MPGWLKWFLALCAVATVTAGYLYLFEPQFGREILSGTPLELPSTVTTAYKWRDAQGNWQLTDQPPPAGTPVEILETRSGDNILPALGDKKN